MAKDSLTWSLAEFARSSATTRLPETAIRAARRSLLDFCGVAIAGSAHPGTIALRESLAPGSTGPSVLIGCRDRASPHDAAQINGFAAHVFDWDDTILPARAHFGATLIPAIMAESAGQAWRINDLIAALVIGFEIQARLSTAMYPMIHRNRWHTTSVVAPLGVAAALAMLLGGTTEEIAQAMGLAANAGSGLMSGFGTSAKALNVGRASAWGLLAAKLAMRGLDAHPDTLDTGGFMDNFADGADRASVVPSPGDRWAIERNGFKPYPCGFVAHPAIDAVRHLRATAPAAGLRHLSLDVASEAMELMGRHYPTSELEAKFSLSYVAAVAWVDGHVTPDAFSEAAICDERYRAAVERISVTVSPSLTQQQARVEAMFENGSSQSLAMDSPRGSSGRPLSDDDLRAKFLSAVRRSSIPEPEATAALILSGKDVQLAEITARLSG